MIINRFPGSLIVDSNLNLNHDDEARSADMK